MPFKWKMVRGGGGEKHKGNTKLLSTKVTFYYLWKKNTLLFCKEKDRKWLKATATVQDALVISHSQDAVLYTVVMEYTISDYSLWNIALAIEAKAAKAVSFKEIKTVPGVQIPSLLSFFLPTI